MSTIAIYGSRRQLAVLDYIALFLQRVRQQGVNVVMHSKVYRHLMEHIPDALEGVQECTGAAPTDVALAVSLGGDGTFLRTTSWIAGRNVPIVGVNSGHLGYLTALPAERLPDLLALIEKDFLIPEARTLLEVQAPAMPDFVGRYALNEIAVLKEETASVIQCDVALGDTPLTVYRADGLVISTATGSTAYNLSIGGPIMQPTLDVCVIAPIAAHSLAMRPLVVDGKEEIHIHCSGRARYVRVALDGRSVTLPMDTEIIVTPAPFKVLVMQLAHHTFADTLREKLHWGEN